MNLHSLPIEVIGNSRPHCSHRFFCPQLSFSIILGFIIISVYKCAFDMAWSESNRPWALGRFESNWIWKQDRLRPEFRRVHCEGRAACEQLRNVQLHYQGRHYSESSAFAQECRKPLRLWHCFPATFPYTHKESPSREIEKVGRPERKRS